jgi:L-iditol 2-dehydrogenase
LFAAQLTSINNLQYIEIPDPVRAEGEVIVKVEACGICGSDRHIVKGEFPSAPPFVLGHEFGGVITEVGPNSELKVGQKVTVDPNIFCGKCENCRLGRVSFCKQLTAHGVHRNGGLAEYVNVPESQIYPMPDDTPAHHLALCEPIGCCVRGLDLANIQPGDSVAILGGGLVGLLMVQLAKLAGATEIYLSTRQQQRRELAEKFGAKVTVDPTTNDPVQMIRQTAKDGVDIVIECAGVAETFQQSIELSRQGGTVLAFGVVPAGEVVGVKPFDIMSKEIKLQGSWINPYTHGRAAEIIKANVLDLDSLISKKFPLSEINQIFDNPPGKGDIKYLVYPDM